MKKLLYSLLSGLAFAALFSACEDVNDQFDELDAQTEIINLAKYNYTLTDADYKTISDAAVKATTDPAEKALAQSINTNKYFTASAPASNYVSYLLKTKYPYGDVGSSALITYSFNAGEPAYLSDYTSASPYTLVTGDYAASGSNILGFYPTVNAATYLPTILGARISDPNDGKIALVKYKQYTETPVINTTTNYLLEENFNYGATDGDLTSLTSNWAIHSGSTQISYSNTSLSMAGYPSTGVGGSVLINEANSEDVNRNFTPQLSGKVYASALVNFNNVGAGTYFLHFMEQDGSFNFASRVSAKDNGSGKILFGVGASSSITYGTTPFDLNTTYLLVTSYDIATATSKLYVLSTAPSTEPETPEATSTHTASFSIQRIGIRQGGGGLTLKLDGLRVTKTWSDLMINNVVETVAGASTNKEVYYKYSGSSWTPAQGIYALSTEDYDSMGTGAGQPGQFDNFSSSIPPENYIPTLLAKLFNYPQNGNKQIVSYKYFSGGTQTRVDEYVFENGKWIKPSSIIEKTEQFVFSNIGWVFDPTIKMTMVSSDYQLMVDYVLNTPSIAIFAHPFYKNEEYYYGFASRYANVNFRLSYRNPYFTGTYVQPPSIDPELNALTTDAAKVALMYTRLKEGMNKFLQLRYPNAVPLVSGLEVNYHVTVKIYYANGLSSGDELHTYIYKCKGAGTGSTPPTFEFISSSKI
ncbi:MAG TPA: hypothetical protein VIN72_13315 [Lutibacter sp.]